MIAPIVSLAVHVSSKSTASSATRGSGGVCGCSPKNADSKRIAVQYRLHSEPAAQVLGFIRVSGVLDSIVECLLKNAALERIAVQYRLRSNLHLGCEGDSFRVYALHEEHKRGSHE